MFSLVNVYSHACHTVSDTKIVQLASVLLTFYIVNVAFNKVTITFLYFVRGMFASSFTEIHHRLSDWRKIIEIVAPRVHCCRCCCLAVCGPYLVLNPRWPPREQGVLQRH